MAAVSVAAFLGKWTLWVIAYLRWLLLAFPLSLSLFLPTAIIALALIPSFPSTSFARPRNSYSRFRFPLFMLRTGLPSANTGWHNRSRTWVGFDLDVPRCFANFTNLKSNQAKLGRQWNGQNQIQPNQGPKPAWSPCARPKQGTIRTKSFDRTLYRFLHLL